MTARLSMTLIGGVSLALGACADATVVQPPYITSSYDPTLLSSAAGYGEIPLEVRGNPFDVPKSELDAVVTSAVDRNTFTPALSFTTSPAEETSSPYKLIVFFNPAPNAQAHKICYDQEQPTAPYEVGVKAMVVFCTSAYRVSSTVASSDGVTSPGDLGFRKLLQQSIAEILPPRRPDINGRDFIRS